MKYLSDLHTHTIVSGHAYTTLLENINYCAQNNIKILGTSEHGSAMPNAPHIWYFGNLRVLPRTINNVIILKGCETNILDIEGNIDMDLEASNSLDYMIASFHENTFTPKSIEENTNAIIASIDKYEKIEILGHLGNPAYKLDYETIVKKCHDKNIMIELNNSSLLGTSRHGSNSNCKYIAELCIKYNTKMILSSDAHICFAIGNFNEGIKLFKEIDFPEELIMNEPKKLINHLKSKGRLKDL